MTHLCSSSVVCDFYNYCPTALLVQVPIIHWSFANSQQCCCTVSPAGRLHEFHWGKPVHTRNYRQDHTWWMPDKWTKVEGPTQGPSMIHGSGILNVTWGMFCLSQCGVLWYSSWLTERRYDQVDFLTIYHFTGGTWLTESYQWAGLWRLFSFKLPILKAMKVGLGFLFFSTSLSSCVVVPTWSII